jgi:1-pyrroline-4-hydroxy-2-carboxylate deaminase
VLYDNLLAGRLTEARELYRHLVAVFRWDSRTEFVQAIKLGMDLVGRYGGPCRPPRGPLTAEHEARVRADLRRAVDGIAALRPLVA